MIQLQHVCKTYGEGENAHHALRNVNLTINDGDVFGIIGASGAGKSTLVRCLNLLERPTEGAILYDGRDITGLSGRALLELRSQVGMIFQNFSLFQQRTVLRNVTFPLELRGEKGEAARKRAMELLELVGLADLAERYPSQLSGGQQQRVAIARALANNPKVMLCDEATSALDTRTTASILQLLQDINRELGVTLVVITHSLPVACKICNRVAVIDHGRIVEEGATAAVFGNPQSPVTRELLANDDMLAAIEREDGTIVPKIKISENTAKITNPHYKKLYRIYEGDSGKAIADLITVHDEVIDTSKPLELFDPEHIWKRKVLEDYRIEELQKPIFLGGKCVYESPTASEIRDYCAAQLDLQWDEVKRFENPHNYYVDLSQKLWDVKQALLSGKYKA